MRQLSLEDAFDRSKPSVAAPHATSLGVVDLFCGAGGFSLGAEQAGHTLLLAVDHDQLALDVHRANLAACERVCATLPDVDVERRVLAVATPYHLHGSPPCNRLSNASPVRDRTEEGMALVRWYLDLVERAERATSWSMEQVVHPLIVAELERRRRRRPALFDFAVVHMAHFGVPQSRRRLVAASPALVERLRDAAQPLRVPRVVDCLRGRIPEGACGLKGKRAGLARSVVKRRTKAFDVLRLTRSAERRVQRGGLRRPAPTVVASGPLVWTDAAHRTVRTVSVEEHQLLQTFDADFWLPSNVRDALRLVGNAVPPLFVRQLLGCTSTRTAYIDAESR